MCLNWGNLSECERCVHIGWCEYTAAEEEALFSGMFIGQNTQTGQLDTGAEHPKFMPRSFHGQYYNTQCKRFECEDKTQPVNISIAPASRITCVNVGVLVGTRHASPSRRALWPNRDAAATSKPGGANIWCPLTSICGMSCDRSELAAICSAGVGDCCFSEAPDATCGHDVDDVGAKGVCCTKCVAYRDASGFLPMRTRRVRSV